MLYGVRQNASIKVGVVITRAIGDGVEGRADGYS